MKILLSSIREERKILELEAPLRLAGLEDRADEGKLDATVTVDQAGDRWRIEASLRGVFPFRCDRCRRSFEGELTGEFQLLVLSRMAGRLDPDEDDAVILLPAGVAELDLDEQIQEALWLDIPMTLSCDGSEGMSCPGPRRAEAVTEGNEGEDETETADEAEIDPRWGPLAEMKKQMEAAEQTDRASREEQRED